MKHVRAVHNARGTALAVLLLAALALVGCGAPQPTALRFGPAPWDSGGETATYRVIDNDGVPVGTATFTVSKGTVDDPDGWTLRREFTTNLAQEIAVVEMSEQGFRPTTSTMVRILPDGTEQVRATYEGSEVSLELTTRQSVTTYERTSVPSDARDQRALPLIVRALPLADGYAVRLNSFFPITGRLERASVAVRDRTQITTPGGTFDTYHLLLDTGESESEVWIGVEPPYPLVKFTDPRAGAVYELESITPGAQ